MRQTTRKHLTFFLIFGTICCGGLLVTEYWHSYFSSIEGIGRGIALTAFVTMPAGILAFVFLIRFILDIRKHSK